MTASPVEIRQTSEQPTAVVRYRGSLATIGEAVQKGLGHSYEVLQRAGIAPAGPPVVRYLSMTPDEIDAEIGWPVSAPFAPHDDVVGASLPACRVAFTSYFGPYEGVGEAYEAIRVWCASQGLNMAGAPWESYLTDPVAEPDPAKWQTDLYQPVDG